MQIINPATEKVIADLKEDSTTTLEHKLRLLQFGQVKWAAVPLTERIAVMKRFSALLEEHTETLAAILTSEVGKPLQQSRNEINGARARIKWLKDHAVKYLSDEEMYADEKISEVISYEPLGVVCNISAWNYPFLVGVNVFVPALLAGNAVMYKPSEHATLTGIEIEKYLKQAGVPDDVFHVAVGAGKVGKALLELPFDGYYFTGSYKTGKHIYEAVAHKMVPCQLELGGKDPLYVANDVTDIKSVVAGTADGAFYNNGQSCCSVERIYVHEDIYEEYVKEFEKEVKSWKVGKPTDEGVYITVLTREEQIGVLEAQVKDAIHKGAVLLTGGKRLDQPGYYFQPTVIRDAQNDMLVMQEESFGPIIGIAKVKDDAEAIKLMNDTAYGLTAAVYTADKERADAILANVNSGTGYWNCCDRVSAALPWSGRKHSGFGSTLSHSGLRAFTKTKSLHLRK